MTNTHTTDSYRPVVTSGDEIKQLFMPAFTLYTSSLMKLLLKTFFSVFLSILIFCSGAKASLTISGISSGGAMAAQMATIYSDQFSGVATAAGVFYYCAQNDFETKVAAAKKTGSFNLSLFKFQMNRDKLFSLDPKSKFGLDPANPMATAINVCLKNPEVAQMPLETLKDFEAKGLIQPVHHISKQKILIYQGSLDSVVQPAMADRLAEFYAHVGVPPENVKMVLKPGGHNFPTNKKGLNACTAEKIPYVSSCNYNFAEEILVHTAGITDLQPASGVKNLQNFLKKVSQNRDGFVRPKSLSEYGYLAASQNCLQAPESCHLHVALHGCEMSDDFDPVFDKRFVRSVRLGYIYMRTKESSWPLSPLPYIEQKKRAGGGLKFALNSGFLDYVEKNNVMVLFPQTAITEDNYPLNPKGCWDWFGWTGHQYATNQGVEPQWLMAWIQQLRANPKSFIMSQKP